jgi:hypothetical protein
MSVPLPKSSFRSVWRWIWVTSLILVSGLLVVYSLRKPRPVDQEITFKHATPQLSPVATSAFKPPTWLGKTYQAFETLKAKAVRLSITPRTSPQLKQAVEIWCPKLLLRYPQLAVPMKTLPDNENGFLQLLNLMDRVKAENRDLPFPAQITTYLENKGPWPMELAEAWLTQNQARVAEIHAIGLIGDRSLNHIPIERWFFISSGLPRNFNQILILKARLAAERGEVRWQRRLRQSEPPVVSRLT